MFPIFYEFIFWVLSLGAWDSVGARNSELEEAKNYYEKNDFKNEIIKYENWLALSAVPKDNVYQNLANAYFKAKNFKQANYFYQRSGRSSDKKIRKQAFIQQFFIYFYFYSDTTKAFNYLRKSLETDPSCPIVRFNYELFVKKHGSKVHYKPNTSPPPTSVSAQWKNDNEILKRLRNYNLTSDAVTQILQALEEREKEIIKNL